MKLINITSAKLTNKDFLGMYSKIATLAERITVKDLSAPVENYKKAVDALNEHLLANYEESTGHATCRCDAERNAAYMACRKYVASLCGSPDETVSAAAQKGWVIFEKNANPKLLNQDAATAAINAVTESLRALDGAVLEAMALEPWLAKLEQAQSAFIDAALARGQERDSRVLQATLTLRNQCTDAFKVLTAYALGIASVKGDTSCVNFIAGVNGEIEMRKEQLKSKSTSKSTRKATAGAANAA